MAKKKTATPAEIETVIAAIEKEHGKGVLMRLSGEAKKMEIPAYQIPTGSIGLDIAIGRMVRLPDGRWQTGIGPGRIEEIIGPEGTGKTTFLLQRIANAQSMGMWCALLDMEHNLDPDYARKLGVRMDRLYFAQPEHAEQCLDLAEILVKSGKFGVVGVDSIASLVPKSELEGGMGDQQMGVQAKLMSKACRKISGCLGHGVNTSILFTNQIRHKVGVIFGSPEFTPGGDAMKFYASYRYDCRRKADVTSGSGDKAQRVGHKLRVRVIKNKTNPPFRECEFPLIYGYGIDAVDELFDLCLEKKIIAEENGFFSYQGHSLGHGRYNAVQVLRNDARARYFFYDKLLTLVCDERGYLPDGTPIPGRVQETAPNMVEQFVPNDEDPFCEVKEVTVADTAAEVIA